MERGELLVFSDQLPQTVGTKRNLTELYMLRRKIERILDCLRKQGPDRNSARFAGALDPERVERRGGDDMGELHPRNVERRWQEIIRERCIEELPAVVEYELLVERVSYSLRHAAVDLSGKDQRIDDRTAVVHNDIFEDLQRQRFAVDFHDHGMDAIGGRASRRSEILRGFKTRLGAGTHRAAHRIGTHRKLAETDRLSRHADD